MNQELKRTIDDYLLQVKRAVELFDKQLGVIAPLSAWHTNQIPRKGNLSESVSYEFHGIGCLIIYPDYEVDFDFGPDNRCDGFDLWRLTGFISSFKERYPRYSISENLKKDFESAVADKFVRKIDNSNLYYYR
jgi:hypothetical protein